jgi:ferredoxin
MGLDPNRAINADVQLNDLGDAWLITSQSAKGEEVLKIWEDLLENTEDSITEAISCGLKVDMAGLPEKLIKMFESSIWNDISDPCIGCGTCTYICPTCYCYDINIEKHGQQGSEFRTWDSCMFSEYTQMAGGHNPRPSKRERLRNRFMHKLAYFYDRYGQLLCAGCGRCISNCPVHIDISSFIDRVKEVSA